MSQHHELAASVAATGTDPQILARVVAWLARPRNGPVGLLRACRDVADPARVPTALAAVTAGVGERERAAAARLLQTWADDGVRVALLGDRAYPTRLQAGWPGTLPPPLLAWRGAPPDDAPAVAVVGARRASDYGRDIATWLSRQLADAGVRIVSGGAVGIDAAAHRAALDAPGGTTVVLGCGHAVPYPRTHAQPGGLFDAVERGAGTTCSELLPFEPPRPPAVRARNRVVAGLADAVVVIEGGERSGSLLTASAAADWARPVLAVPGDVRAAGSHAPHRLLAEGAVPCTGPDDVLAALGVDASEPSRATPQPAQLPADVDADGPLAAVAAAWPRTVSVATVVARTGWRIDAVLAVLGRAELDGVVVRDGDAVRLAARSPTTGRGP